MFKKVPSTPKLTSAMLLIVACGLNGLILPEALAVILIAAVKAKIVSTYKHPLWMPIAGWIIVITMIYVGAAGVQQSCKQLW